MAFNFGGSGFNLGGQPASSTPGSTPAASAPLFGQASSAAPTFGSAASVGAASSTPSFSFGAPAPSTGTSAPSLFGAPASSNATSGGLFGAAPKPAAPAGGLFGNPSAAPSSFATPAKPPTFGAGGGFQLGAAAQGSTTPAGTPAAPTLSFGQPAPTSSAPAGASTTPASTPSFSFGGAPSGGSLFGAKRENDAGGDQGGKKPAFGGFGASAATTTPAPAASTVPATSAAPSLFGGFGASSTATSAAGSAAPSAPSLFGAASGASSAPTSAPLSFGAPAASTAPATSATTSTVPAPASTPSLGLFGVPPAASAADGSKPAAAPLSLFGTAPKPAAAPASGASTTPNLFGAASSTSTPAASAPAMSAPTLSFGAPAASTMPSASSTTTPAAPGALSFGTKPAASTALGAAAAAPSLSLAKPATAGTTTLAPGTVATSTASAPVPSMLRGKTLDEIVNGWSAELEERTRDFSDLAGEVREWDRVLRENGEQISNLYTSILPLSPLQSQVTTSLDYVESQQKDLAALLDSYEAQVGELVDQSSTSSGWRGANGSGGGQAEKEREKAYGLATTLSNSLDTTSASLTSLIQTLNALSPASATAARSGDGAEDPLAQIAAILNAHLGSLKWIEGTTEGLKKNVRELEGRVSEVGARMGARDSIGPGARSGTPSRLGGGGGTPGRINSPFASSVRR